MPPKIKSKFSLAGKVQRTNSEQIGPSVNKTGPLFKIWCEWLGQLAELFAAWKRQVVQEISGGPNSITGEGSLCPRSALVLPMCLWQQTAGGLHSRLTDLHFDWVWASYLLPFQKLWCAYGPGWLKTGAERLSSRQGQKEWGHYSPDR